MFRSAAASALPLVLAVALLAPVRAGAQLLVYEPFDYPAATILDGTPATGANLTGLYTGTMVPPGFDLRVDSPGLGYGNLFGAPAPAGNRLNQGLGTTAASATASFAQAVPVSPGSALFFSALFTFDDSLNGNHLANIALTNDDDGDEIGFGEDAVGTRAIRVSANTAATGGLRADGASLAFDSGQTLFLVGRYTNSAAAGGDRLDLIGYDTNLAFALPSAFDPADANAQFAYALAGLDIDLAQITSVTFTIRGTANNFIDELRIGETYAVVAVPEPHAWVLLLVGLAIVLGPVRRRIT
jgi:hypothetical protein